jgi:fatty acid synthase
MLSGENGDLTWNENWISFLDTMMQMQILLSSRSTLRLPTRIKWVRVNPKQHIDSVMEREDGTKGEGRGRGLCGGDGVAK